MKRPFAGERSPWRRILAERARGGWPALSLLVFVASLGLAVTWAASPDELPWSLWHPLAVCLAVQGALGVLVAPALAGTYFGRWRRQARLDELVLTRLRAPYIVLVLMPAAILPAYAFLASLLPLGVAAALAAQSGLLYLAYTVFHGVYGLALSYTAAGVALLGWQRGLRSGAESVGAAAFAGGMWAWSLALCVLVASPKGSPAVSVLLLVGAVPLATIACLAGHDSLVRIIGNWPFEEEETLWWRGTLGGRRLAGRMRALEAQIRSLGGPDARDADHLDQPEATDQVWRALYTSLGAGAAERLRPRLRGDVTALAANLSYGDRDMAEMAANAFCQKVWSLMRVL